MKGSKLVGQEVFASGLDLPFGMALWKDEFFVGEPTRVLKFGYENGKLVGKPTVIAALPFPMPQRHWTRHLLLSPGGAKLFVAVGSASNVGEDEDPLNPENAAILEMDRMGHHRKIFANGLRNPVSMAWHPITHKLWTTVNERDELGDDLVPDYITAVKKGGFYGWPYAYWGKYPDPRRKGERPDLVEKSLTPDYAVGAHTASLGITFTVGTRVPAPFAEGALIAQHGSWNRSTLAGYQVHFVPFVKGEAVDGESEFLTGFIADLDAGKVYGRPVATVVLSDGSVLVSDDAGGKIWKVTPVR
jgi:glucose/arabinose dehydrogenase